MTTSRSASEGSARAIGHTPVLKGDAELSMFGSNWIEKPICPSAIDLPQRTSWTARAAFSEQIDIVVFDRQYSPFMGSYEDQTIVPAEIVYALFEAKQTMNASQSDLCKKAKWRACAGCIEPVCRSPTQT